MFAIDASKGEGFLSDGFSRLVARIFGTEPANNLLSLRISRTADDPATIRMLQEDHIPIVLNGFVCRQGAYCSSDSIAGIYMPRDLCSVDALIIGDDENLLPVGKRTKVGFIPKTLLRDRYKTFAPILWKASARANIRLRKWLEVVATKDAPCAFAFLLCEFRTRLEFRGVDTNTALRLPFTQEQFGKMIGISAIHANRSFSRLKDDGLFNNRRGTFYDCDWEALEAIAAFDDSYLWLNDSQRLRADRKV